MKFIEKGPEPPKLRAWREENTATPQNLYYSGIPVEHMKELRKRLHEEQGRICGYTMIRIASLEQGHIEHVWPQSRGDHRRQVDYRNLVYCVPGDGERLDFGAQRKDNAEVTHADFLSPLDISCEERFRFERVGTIAPNRPEDKVAAATIELLKLDHDVLVRARRAAMLQLPIFMQRRRPLASGDAQKFAAIAIKLDANGNFAEFAVAIFQVLTRHAKRRAAAEAARRSSQR